MGVYGHKSNRAIGADQVKVRLTRSSESVKWGRLMCEHHDLGFMRFADRSLRYIAEHEGRWHVYAGGKPVY